MRLIGRVVCVEIDVRVCDCGVEWVDVFGRVTV